MLNTPGYVKTIVFYSYSLTVYLVVNVHLLSVATLVVALSLYNDYSLVEVTGILAYTIH